MEEAIKFVDDNQLYNTVGMCDDQIPTGKITIERAKIACEIAKIECRIEWMEAYGNTFDEEDIKFWKDEIIRLKNS